MILPTTTLLVYIVPGNHNEQATHPTYQPILNRPSLSDAANAAKVAKVV
jgi:hypothetical protein